MKTDTMISPLMQTYNRFHVNPVKGKGCYVWDADGHQYLDFTSGIGTCNLGHVPDAVKTKLMQQLENLWHCSNLYHINVQEQLAVALTENSCLEQVFFCNSGAEANEAAIKLARLYHPERSNIITFQQSFHGRTMATLSASGQEKIQIGFAPLLSGFTQFPYNDLDHLTKLKEELPAAVMLELVQGEGGVHPAEQQWIDELVQICTDDDILLIVDEVQTGMGRTGTLFAHEQYGFDPDVVTIAKGLGSGFPIGAMMAKKEVSKAFQPGTHGSTFGGNPLAATAGLATINELQHTSAIVNGEEKSHILLTYLNQLKQDFPQLKAIRGRGLLIGIETDSSAGDIVKAAIKEKLLILTAGPTVIRLLPPLTITEDDVTLFAKKFRNALQQVYA
ncbi:aspartate aminotransferase family protein [Lentibacillus daqui]|uniref:aspartate aminotransferase family protein n=1 Tax=Lentibacillus daqui TaxID=2911514 RepID=UPI0022B1B01B|nr:aspartate aminotransferase family protein [Lentibacillus daqui]